METTSMFRIYTARMRKRSKAEHFIHLVRVIHLVLCTKIIIYLVLNMSFSLKIDVGSKFYFMGMGGCR